MKDGCSEGACGTCTVLVDGKATKACVQKMGRMEGKHILTVEGFSQREKDVYVYAFGQAGAVQCGFCIPGMVICAKGLLDVNPNPSRVEIAHAIRDVYKRQFLNRTGYQNGVLVGEQTQILHDLSAVNRADDTAALVGHAASADLGVVLVALVGIEVPVVLVADANGVDVGVKTD